MKGKRQRVRRSRTSRAPSRSLKVGGMDGDVQQKAERIEKDVALAPDDLLARIKPLRVKRGAPFWAALALWLSMFDPTSPVDSQSLGSRNLRRWNSQLFRAQGVTDRV